VAFAIGWKAYVRHWQHGVLRPLAWRDLSAQLGPLRFPRPTFRVFLRRAKLEEYLGAVMPGAAPEPPPIDYTHRKAVLIAVGPRSSTGYVLHVERVVEERSQVVVFVRERSPTLRDRVTPEVTYPYRLITIPRISKPTVLDTLGR
jgi:PrcB C-terminal